MNLEIHNLLKNPTDLPPVAPGNRHGESLDVQVFSRIIIFNSETGSYEFELTLPFRSFYCHTDNEWYSYYDDPLHRMSDCFGDGGNQTIETLEIALEMYPKEIVDKLTKVTRFKCEDLEGDWVFTGQIVGWFEIPTYEEFIKNS